MSFALRPTPRFPPSASTLAPGGRGTRAWSVVAALVLSGPAVAGPVGAQTLEGTTLSMAGGAALGMYSGAMTSLVGSLLPCNRTLTGGRCAASGASVGAALGLTMGGLIGAESQDDIVGRLEGAGYGALVGVAIGVGLRRAIRQYQWGDAAAMAMYGAAVGAAPRGSLIGVGVGAAVGGVVWLAFDDAALPDFLMFALAGSAVGTLLDWAHGAATVRQRPPSPFSSSFSIPFR